MARKDVAFLPIPGIKPMLGLVILAQGKWAGNTVRVGTVTDPGYPTPQTWCKYLETPFYALPTHPENSFLPGPDDIRENTTLLHLNFPHNPSGAYATRAWWEEMCAFCEKHNIRIFNDGAYAMLWHTQECCTLSEVAVNFPDLSWVEAFSVSKAIGNGTGWRVGSIVGSLDFVADIAEIKGNTDSGFFAPAAAGAIYCLETDMASVIASRQTYGTRIKNLISVLRNRGMHLATEPGAGFFTLWKAPRKAFGEDIADGKAFNWAMIEKTGLTGVHFGPYFRTAVVEELDGDMLDRIDWAFKKANPSY